MNAPAPKGYVALVSALLISVLLALLVLAANMEILRALSDVQRHIDRLRARHLALSCLSAAAYALAIDPAFTATGTEIYISPSDTCQMRRITHAGSDTLVRVSAFVHDAGIYLEGTITDEKLSSWKEVNAI